MDQTGIYLPLLSMLQRRRSLIADHAWRDRDPSGHLAALQDISGQLEQEHQRLNPTLPPRLRHYLVQCSYDKAAAWIEAGGKDA